jgi:hypothetical protein
MMKQIAERQDSLPGPQGTERVQGDAQALVTRLRQARECAGPAEISHDQHLLNVMDSVARDFEKLRTKFDALRKPASKVQIANHLGLLVKSFPNVGKGDIEIYGKILPHDVAAQRPTVGAIEAACRHLRRTARFIPTIAEVISALSDAEGAQRDLTRVLEDLPHHRSRLADRIRREAEERERFRRELEDRANRKMLAIGSDTDGEDVLF